MIEGSTQNYVRHLSEQVFVMQKLGGAKRSY